MLEGRRVDLRLIGFQVLTLLMFNEAPGVQINFEEPIQGMDVDLSVSRKRKLGLMDEGNNKL